MQWWSRVPAPPFYTTITARRQSESQWGAVERKGEQRCLSSQCVYLANTDQHKTEIENIVIGTLYYTS